MPLFFQNEGTTCFFNAAMQLCLNNPHFRAAVLDPRYLAQNHSGFVQVLAQFVREVNQHTSPREAAIAKVRELLPHFPFLADYVRTNQHGDVMECLDAIFDKLSLPGTTRPSVVTFTSADGREEALKTLRDQIRAHCGTLEVVWGVQEQVSTCMECNQVVLRELIPFTWVSRVMDKHEVSGVDCSLCHARAGRREVVTRLFDIPRGLIVRVRARHRDDGTKDNRSAVLRERVEVATGTFYDLQSMVYHEGWSFSSGHYITAVRIDKDHPWVLNSDASCQMAKDGFSIEAYRPQCTYAALYLLDA
jgi:hypothetical protein